MTNVVDQFKGMDIPGLTWGNMSTPEGQLLIRINQVKGEKQHLSTHKLYLESRIKMLDEMEQKCEQDLATVRAEMAKQCAGATKTL